MPGSWPGRLSWTWCRSSWRRCATRSARCPSWSWSCTTGQTSSGTTSSWCSSAETPRGSSFLLLAKATVAQSVKRPELRSLKEVQLSGREFDSWLWHRSYGKSPSHAIVGVWGKERVRRNKSTEWASSKKSITFFSSNGKSFSVGDLRLLDGVWKKHWGFFKI